MSRPPAGAIVKVNWRVDALPREPTKLRPAVVVEDDGLFPDAYPNTIVVPLTHDQNLAFAAFSEPIEPDLQNGSVTTSWALGHHVTSVSLSRITPTASRITPGQLAGLRARISLAIGVPNPILREPR